MRRSPTLDALFPEIRQGILAVTFTQPEKWWYFSEIAEALHTSPSSLQRETKTLTRSGILEQRKDGKRVYVRPNAKSPLFAELRGIIEKTAGVVPALRSALEPFGNRIKVAFIYGSMAR